MVALCGTFKATTRRASSRCPMRSIGAGRGQTMLSTASCSSGIRFAHHTNVLFFVNQILQAGLAVVDLCALLVSETVLVHYTPRPKGITPPPIQQSGEEAIDEKCPCNQLAPLLSVNYSWSQTQRKHIQLDQIRTLACQHEA